MPTCSLKSSAGASAAATLTDAAVAGLRDGSALVVEDIDRGIADEQALFHLLNRARESRLSVLLTSCSAPGDLEFRIPDLRSRLRALPVVALEAPDEALLKAVLVKLFVIASSTSSRATNTGPRMERSMAAAASRVWWRRSTGWRWRCTAR